MIKKIVLTGGPCAGKTTIISLMKQELSKQGYKVFIVGESATELINGGIIPNDNGVGMFNFQRLILGYQYKKEEVYNRALIDTNEENIVIIYDRALLDNRAYISDIEFDMLLSELSLELDINLDENSILSRYDMVIHLVTSAGNRGYSLESNIARYEDERDAILLDRKILASWSKHNNLHIVESTTNFNDKINKVMSLLFCFLEKEECMVKCLKM